MADSYSETEGTFGGSRPTTAKEKLEFLKEKYSRAKEKVSEWNRNREERNKEKDLARIEKLSRKQRLLNAQTGYANAQRRYARASSPSGGGGSMFGGFGGGNLDMFMPPKQQNFGGAGHKDNLDFLLGPRKKQKGRRKGADDWFGGGLI